MLDRFKEFIKERHSIYLRRAAGLPAPWTEDYMLREFKFTNIYRELDRTTIWCKDFVRDRQYDTLFHQAMAIFAFRFFNRIRTGEAMFTTGAWQSFMRTGDTSILRQMILSHCGKGPYTTGAYIIKTVNGMNKLDGALWAIKAGQPVIFRLTNEKPAMLAQAQAILLEAPYLGSFMAAQLVADMKYTPLLDKALDWHTWAANGPGSRRGLNLLVGAHVDQSWRDGEWLDELLKLRVKILPMFKELGWEEPHAQDVQNMLCEFSKYIRGYSRNKFKPSK